MIVTADIDQFTMLRILGERYGSECISIYNKEDINNLPPKEVYNMVRLQLYCIRSVHFLVNKQKIHTIIPRLVNLVNLKYIYTYYLRMIDENIYIKEALKTSGKFSHIMFNNLPIKVNNNLVRVTNKKLW